MLSEEKARGEALRQATWLYKDETPEEIVKRAEMFYKFLMGQSEHRHIETEGYKGQ